MKTVFLDSSVLFCAVKSISGGSAKLFTLSKIKLTTSPLVLTETERNVRKKLESYHLERFFTLVSRLEILQQEPDASLTEIAQKVIVEKDAAILADAKKAKTDFLATLDKKHFQTEKVKNYLRPQKVATPKDLIERFR